MRLLGRMTTADALIWSGLSKSKSEAKRAVKAGAVRIRTII
jgi:hypothetical protein